jgi:hypothetical protein
MAVSERIVFQPYLRGKRGGLAPGPAMACRNPAEAERRAEKAMAGGKIIGGHMVRMRAADAAGEYGEPEYLAALGTVPEPV